MAGGRFQVIRQKAHVQHLPLRFRLFGPNGSFIERFRWERKRRPAWQRRVKVRLSMRFAAVEYDGSPLVLPWFSLGSARAVVA